MGIYKNNFPYFLPKIKSCTPKAKDSFQYAAYFYLPKTQKLLFKLAPVRCFLNRFAYEI